MSAYDFIIAGGGAAGLGLAYEISLSSLRGRRVLVLDRDARHSSDRTWGFWTDRPTRFDHLALRSWDRVEVISGSGARLAFDLTPYRYRMIRAIDFYQGVRGALSQTPGVELRQARISTVFEAADRSEAAVRADNDLLRARWAFDSTFTPSDYAHGPAGCHSLRRHFKGWEIETPGDCFDPSTVTLFDFRTPQKDCLRFFYLLPLTRRRALVEYTLFSADLLKGNEYDRAIADYLENVRRIPSYRIDATESGSIPMTDRPFPRRLHPHVMAIGTRGGLVKASLGCAFLRIQKDAAAVVRSLVETGSPFQVPTPPLRYRLFDRLALQVLYRQGSRAAEIFTTLFQRNPIQDIFRFLDESAPLGENARLIATLPRAPFLRALVKVMLLRQI